MSKIVRKSKSAKRMAAAATADFGNKIQTYIPAGMASAGPPLGPMLGQKGVNIAAFCKDFNERTKDMKEGIPLPTRVTVRPDRSYELIIHKPPASYYLKQAAGIDRGAMAPGQEISGKVTLKHVYEIAKIKSEDPPMEMFSLQDICKMLIGTAKSCGIEVVQHLDCEEYKEFLEERRKINEEQLKELEEKKLSKVLRTSV